MITIGIIGFGKMGVRYFNSIKKSKEFSIINILKNNRDKSKIKHKAKIFVNSKKFFLNSKKIDAYIVASPSNTHYNYLKKIIKLGKPLLIEKPIVNNSSELKKTIDLVKKYKNTRILVNHIDLYNPAFDKFKKNLKSIGSYKIINMKFGKFQNIYQGKNQPYFEWLPHPLALTIKLMGLPLKTKLFKNITVIKNKRIFQEMNLELIAKKKITNISFSNSYINPKREIKIIGSNGYIKYDASNINRLIIKIKNKKKTEYRFKNNSPMEYLLKNFHNMIKYNKKNEDFNLSLNVMKILLSLDKKIKK